MPVLVLTITEVGIERAKSLKARVLCNTSANQVKLFHIVLLLHFEQCCCNDKYE